MVISKRKAFEFWSLMPRKHADCRQSKSNDRRKAHSGWNSVIASRWTRAVGAAGIDQRLIVGWVSTYEDQRRLRLMHPLLQLRNSYLQFQLAVVAIGWYPDECFSVGSQGMHCRFEAFAEVISSTTRPYVPAGQATSTIRCLISMAIATFRLHPSPVGSNPFLKTRTRPGVRHHRSPK
jgi:hypothetical protein